MGAETKKQKKQEDSNRSPWLDGYKTLGELISCLIFVTILFVFAIRLVGVVLIFSSGLGILQVKQVKTLNLLPALLVPPVAVGILSLFGI